MSESKLRGTREQRVEAAIKRKKEALRRQKRPIYSLLIFMTLLLFSGFVAAYFLNR